MVPSKDQVWATLNLACHALNAHAAKCTRKGLLESASLAAVASANIELMRDNFEIRRKEPEEKKVDGPSIELVALRNAVAGVREYAEGLPMGYAAVAGILLSKIDAATKGKPAPLSPDDARRVIDEAIRMIEIKATSAWEIVVISKLRWLRANLPSPAAARRIGDDDFETLYGVANACFANLGVVRNKESAVKIGRAIYARCAELRGEKVEEPCKECGYVAWDGDGDCEVCHLLGSARQERDEAIAKLNAKPPAPSSVESMTQAQSLRITKIRGETLMDDKGNKALARHILAEFGPRPLDPATLTPLQLAAIGAALQDWPDDDAPNRYEALGRECARAVASVVNTAAPCEPLDPAKLTPEQRVAIGTAFLDDKNGRDGKYLDYGNWCLRAVASVLNVSAPQESRAAKLNAEAVECIRRTLAKWPTLATPQSLDVVRENLVRTEQALRGTASSPAPPPAVASCEHCRRPMPSGRCSCIEAICRRIVPKSDGPVVDALRAACDAFGGDDDPPADNKAACYAKLAAPPEDAALISHLAAAMNTHPGEPTLARVRRVVNLVLAEFGPKPLNAAEVSDDVCRAVTQTLFANGFSGTVEHGRAMIAAVLKHLRPAVALPEAGEIGDDALAMIRDAAAAYNSGNTLGSTVRDWYHGVRAYLLSRGVQPAADDRLKRVRAALVARIERARIAGGGHNKSPEGVEGREALQEALDIFDSSAPDPMVEVLRWVPLTPETELPENGHTYLVQLKGDGHFDAYGLSDHNADCWRDRIAHYAGPIRGPRDAKGGEDANG